jgi:hypothetical protein
MTTVKTELATLRQHDNAVRNAIERRAYTFFESDDFKDGHDQEHWFRAERELTFQDIPFAIGDVALSLRLALEDFPASTLIISISGRSVLIFSLKNDASNDCEGNEAIDRECLRIISLPVEIDAAQVTSELNDNDLALRLPLVAGALTVSMAALA